MNNLPYVKNDLLTARSIVEMMDVKEENRYEFIDQSKAYLDKFEVDFKWLIKAQTEVLSNNTKIGSTLKN